MINEEVANNKEYGLFTNVSYYTEEDLEYVYMPQEDTLHLLKALDNIFAKKKISSILEIGCGSGVISAFCASRNPSATITCSDINSKALDLCARTFEFHKLVRPNLVRMDLLTALKPGYSPDLIIFNPPYVPSPSNDIWSPERQREYEEAHEKVGFRTCLDFALDGGVDGTEVTYRFLEQLINVLDKEAVAVLVTIEDNYPDKILEWLDKHGFCGEKCERASYEAEELVIIEITKK